MLNSKIKLPLTHSPSVKIKQLLYCIFTGILFSPTVFAITPFVDTGKLLRDDEKDISAHAIIHHLSAEEKTGFHLVLTLDQAHWSQKSLNMRYFLGGGTTGFNGGAFLKWVPFPDYKWQPALGIAGGGEYQFAGIKTHIIKLHIRPFISKKLDTPVGSFSPYLAFPVSIDINNFTQVQIPLRFALGVKGEMFFIDFRKLFLNIEFSTALAGQSPFYFSVGVLTYWTDRSAAW